jgi:hypothetical protein
MRSPNGEVELHRRSAAAAHHHENRRSFQGRDPGVIRLPTSRQEDLCRSEDRCGKALLSRNSRRIAIDLYPR